MPIYGSSIEAHLQQFQSPYQYQYTLNQISTAQSANYIQQQSLQEEQKRLASLRAATLRRIRELNLEDALAAEDRDFDEEDVRIIVEKIFRRQRKRNGGEDHDPELIEAVTEVLKQAATSQAQLTYAKPHRHDNSRIARNLTEVDEYMPSPPSFIPVPEISRRSVNVDNAYANYDLAGQPPFVDYMTWFNSKEGIHPPQTDLKSGVYPGPEKEYAPTSQPPYSSAQQTPMSGYSRSPYLYSNTSLQGQANQPGQTISPSHRYSPSVPFIPHSSPVHPSPDSGDGSTLPGQPQPSRPSSYYQSHQPQPNHSPVIDELPPPYYFATSGESYHPPSPPSQNEELKRGSRRAATRRKSDLNAEAPVLRNKLPGINTPSALDILKRLRMKLTDILSSFEGILGGGRPGEGQVKTLRVSVGLLANLLDEVDAVETSGQEEARKERKTLVKEIVDKSDGIEAFLRTHGEEVPPELESGGKSFLVTSSTTQAPAPKDDGIRVRAVSPETDQGTFGINLPGNYHSPPPGNNDDEEYVDTLDRKVIQEEIQRIVKESLAQRKSHARANRDFSSGIYNSPGQSGIESRAGTDDVVKEEQVLGGPADMGSTSVPNPLNQGMAKDSPGYPPAGGGAMGRISSNGNGGRRVDEWTNNAI